jgi:hypothetical protein
MPPVQIVCPACQSSLRVSAATPAGRLRCPRCKEIFETVIDGEVLEDSESVAVVLNETATSSDPDQSFFSWLANANDPLGKKPANDVLVDAEYVEPVKPRQEPSPSHDDEEAAEVSRSSNRGIAAAVAALAALTFFVGIAGAGYLAYRIWPGQPAEDESPPASIKSLDKNPPSGDASSTGKLKAATVQVRTHYPDGQIATASGFFVPGPGLVVTNARSVGQGKKPAPVNKIQVLLGSRSLAARVLGADGELDLALLQVTAFDLPEPLGLGADTFTVKEPQAVVVFNVPEGEVRSVVSSSATISGTRTVAGTRPWFTLDGRLPQGFWGGPVADSAGRVIGIAGIIPGSETSSALPIESVQAFVLSTVQSVEANGPVTANPPGPPSESKKKPRDEFDDGPPVAIPPEVFRFNRPRMQPPGWNQPIMPLPLMPPGFDPPVFPQPGFPRGGRQPGVPRPKVSFPPVEPIEIKPAPLGQDRMEMKLPGKVADTCAGGGGRYWFLLIPSEKQIAVFDTASAKIVKNLAVGDNVKFAAGMHKLVVAGADGRLTRYDLKTFESEEVGKAPFEGTIQQMAMGSASGGPLFVTYQRHDGRLPMSSYAILDLSTFKELEPGPAGGRTGVGFNRQPMQLRASPDGRTITSFGGGEHMWCTYALGEDGAVLKTRHEPGVIVSPSEDGALLASTAILTPDGRPIGRKQSPALRIPAQQGPFFLTIAPEREPLAFPDPNRVIDGPQTITLNLPGNDRPAAALPNPGVSIPLNFGWDGVPGLQADRRVFFSPAAHLIGLVDDGRMVLLRFNPESAAEKSGANYLYVASRPPLAVRGLTYRYPVVVKSKAGGVQVRIDSGPPGMRVEGQTVVWDVPQRGAIRPDLVIATITDASGQEVSHTFTLRVKE